MEPITVIAVAIFMIAMFFKTPTESPRKIQKRTVYTRPAPTRPTFKPTDET